eukprot:1739139-Lingulodinium_polyedra.AAC.1
MQARAATGGGRPTGAPSGGTAAPSAQWSSRADGAAAYEVGEDGAAEIGATQQWVQQQWSHQQWMLQQWLVQQRT